MKERSPQNRILRRAECQAATGLSYWTLQRMAKRGEFPAPIRLSAGAMGWIEDEVLAWRNARPRTLPTKAPRSDGSPEMAEGKTAEAPRIADSGWSAESRLACRRPPTPARSS